jgi:holo-[acyl-carrier protein] synthase
VIIGTGMDLIEIARVREHLHHKKVIERILTEPEQDVFNNISHPRRKEEFLAGRFAVKEAYAKARGTGIGSDLSWQDIVVLNDEFGKPVLKSLKDKENTVHLSITHTKEYAAAFVIIESLSG